MKRRVFLRQLLVTTAVAPFAVQVRASESSAPASDSSSDRLEPSLVKDWLSKWEQHIVEETKTRYCDRENGEEIGWLISPFLNGFYYGYLATRDAKWIEHLMDWGDSWIKRGIKEPDGFVGWPKNGTGGLFEKDLFTDSLLGEAMGLRPLVLMAREIRKDNSLNKKFGAQAESYVNLAEQTFEKWISRGCWREVEQGGVWVVPAFGIDSQSGKWTDGYARRREEGFSNPDNKQNHIARWLLAMHDVTGKAVYEEHAKKWFQVLKSRLKPRENGKYLVWNYWEPAGPWDYNADGSTKHWVGVHSNGGYYTIDVEGMVAAFERKVIFTKEDVQLLVATNRDFMWNQQVAGASFRRIDGGEPDPRWKDTPGVLWTALLPYDQTLRKIFLRNHNPASWGGLIATPWFIARLKSGEPFSS